jgi:hypothetical protein
VEELPKFVSVRDPQAPAAHRTNRQALRRPARKKKATANTLSLKASVHEITLQDETGELGGLLKSLGSMLLVLAYAVAAIAFTAVVYIRIAVLAAAGIIGYPLAVLATALVLGLFVVPLCAFFRKKSTLSVGSRRRALHAALR